MVRILWAICSSLIIVLGIYFTKYFNFFHLKLKNYKNIFKSDISGVGISPFQALMLTLGGRIGVGNIAGVALAIYIGGSGTIFWIWVITIIALPLSYIETYLGSIYKKKINNEYVGGPSYYILNGLNNKFLAYFYSAILFLNFIFGFLGIQVNTIVKGAQALVPISPFIIGIILLLITFFIIIGDVFKISKITSHIVPFMLILYVVLCMFVLICNIKLIPLTFLSIIKDAFNLKPFLSGFLYKVIIGTERGIFSSEVGVGTGSISSCASSSLNPKKDGVMQMFGILITTFICTITAFFVLMCPYQTLDISDVNGIEIASYAFFYHFNNIGVILLFIFIFLFSFSTILTGYYNASVSLKFIFNKRFPKKLFILITLVMILISSLVSSKIMWSLVDLFIGILILINLYAIFKLRDKIKKP